MKDTFISKTECLSINMKNRRATISVIKRVYVNLPPKRRREVFILGLLMVVVSSVEVISISSIIPFLTILTAPEDSSNIIIFKPLIDLLNISSVSGLRLTFALSFIVLILVSGIFRALFTWRQIKIGMLMSIDISSEVYEKTLYLPYSEIIRKNSGEILAGAQKAKDMVGSIIQPALTLISAIFMLAVVMLALLAINPLVAVSTILGFGIIYYMITSLSRKLLNKNSAIYAKELGAVNRVIQEGIGGIRDVKIDQLERSYSTLYRMTLTKMQNAAASTLLLSQMPRFIIEMLGMIMLTILAYAMVDQQGGVISAIPIVGFVALAAQRMLPVLQQAYAAYISIRGGVDSTLDVLEIIEKKTQKRHRDQDGARLCFETAIELKSVGFVYPNSNKIILKNIDLRITKGARVGIIGETGSGKTTLMDLLMGLIPPSAGEIYIDNQKLDEFNIAQWRTYISHVPQSIYLSDSSVAENIAFGVNAEQIDLPRVCAAAEAAQLTITVESFDEGLDTNIGERGVRLSGGQRQRIGIARALYKQSKLLFIDEGTSALDSATELAVIDQITKSTSPVTVICIAHRLTTLRSCDFIIELKDGGITWVGTYDELVHKKKDEPMFKQRFEHQSSK